MKQDSSTTVAVIGAGPYGLSVAAHLLGAGTHVRIFGSPMHRWRFQMPKGMFLKSEGIASSLSDPEGRCTLGRYCAEKSLPYDDRAMPVSLETFVSYAMAFQKRLVPDVEDIKVTNVERSGRDFVLQLADGRSLRAARVVVATGLEQSEYIPEVFAGLPRDLISHSSEHVSLGCFRGKTVVLVGGGQSAIETAALLSELGAKVSVIVRKPEVQWNSPPGLEARSVVQRLRYPLSDLGEGLQLWVYCNAAWLFRHFPRKLRLYLVKNVLDAAGAWWLRSRWSGSQKEPRFDILTGFTVQGAQAFGGRVVLAVSGTNGKIAQLKADHVIAATGYRCDVRSLPFLGAEIQKNLRIEDGRPTLSARFESTVPGLYFTGVTSANSFGPLMRFIAGTKYTARTISRRIAAEMPRHARGSRAAVASAGR